MSTPPGGPQQGPGPDRGWPDIPPGQGGGPGGPPRGPDPQPSGRPDFAGPAQGGPSFGQPGPQPGRPGAYGGYGAYAGGPQGPGPQGPGAPQGPGPQGPGPQRPPRDPAAAARTRKIVIGVVAAVVVLAVAIGGILLYQKNQREQEARRAEEARIAEENRQKASAQAAVQAYYDALGAADVDKITSLTQTPPSGAERTDLLTREVLAEAMKKAPIKDTRLTPQAVTPTTATVGAAYTIGDKPVTTTHQLVKDGDAWKLELTSAPVSVGSTGPVRQVNGKEVAAGRYRMFPGGYSVTTANPFLTVTDGDFVVADLGGFAASPSPKFDINDNGKRESVEAAKRALADCTGKKELSPLGCPMIRWRVDAGTTVDPSSLRFTVKGDPWAGVQPTCTQSLIRCRVSYRVTIEAAGRGTSPRGPVTLSGEQTTSVSANVALESGKPEVTMS